MIYTFKIILITDESIPSYSGSDIPRHDSSMWSKVTEEGTELSQRLVRSGFTGPEVDPENEELMLNISSRLQAAVEKLLEAISETSSQVTFLMLLIYTEFEVGFLLS